MTITAHCQELQSFCFCCHLCKQVRALQLHFLKQKETAVITSVQTTVPDVLGTADLQMSATYGHRLEIQLPRGASDICFES